MHSADNTFGACDEKPKRRSPKFGVRYIRDARMPTAKITLNVIQSKNQTVTVRETKGQTIKTE